MASFDTIEKLTDKSSENVGSSNIGGIASGLKVEPIEMPITIDDSLEDLKGKIQNFINWVKITFEPITYTLKGMWESIKSAYDKWAKPIWENMKKAYESISATVKKVWGEVSKFIKDLWDNHLKRLWDNILDFVGDLINLALIIYNQVIAPIIDWLVTYFLPVAEDVIVMAVDIANGIIEAMKGIIDFLTGIFTGDWGKAWEGIKEVFEGIWETIKAVFIGFKDVWIDIWEALKDAMRGPINGIIDFINNLVINVIIGINKVISKINHMIAEFNRMAIDMGLGFTIKMLNPLQLPDMIPHLAKGAVIPPNKEFMAILGDQKSGVNIETPLATMVQGFKQAMSETGGTGDLNANITLEIDGEKLYNQQQRIKIRRGTRLVTGGAY